MPFMKLVNEDTQHQNGMRQRLVNMIYEPTPQGPDPAIWFPRPGLKKVEIVGLGPTRCTFSWNGNRITVSGNQVYFNSASVGAIPGTDLCRFAISDDEVVIVAFKKAYYITSTSVTIIDDPDLPENICDVLFLTGRFVYLDADSAKFCWSDLNDARNIDGLSFATAAENSASNLIGGGVLVDQLVFFLGQEVEWWYAADDPDNPFQYSQGRKYNKGLASRDTIVLLDNTLFFLGSDRIVYRASTVPTVVSSFSIGDRLRKISDTDLARCSAFGCSYAGHTFYILTMPGQGSWAFDIATGKWEEWTTYGSSRLQISCSDGDMLGDLSSGTLMRFDAKTYTDMGNPIERIISAFVPLASGHVRNFNAYLKCVRGVGLLPNQYGDSPVVEMRFSDHEGQDFTPWRTAPLGVQGDRNDTAKAIWPQLGMIKSPGRLFEFRCTDPVYFSCSQAQFNAERI